MSCSHSQREVCVVTIATPAWVVAAVHERPACRKWKENPPQANHLTGLSLPVDRGWITAKAGLNRRCPGTTAINFACGPRHWKWTANRRIRSRCPHLRRWPWRRCLARCRCRAATPKSCQRRNQDDSAISHHPARASHPARLAVGGDKVDGQRASLSLRVDMIPAASSMVEPGIRCRQIRESANSRIVRDGHRRPSR